MTTNFFHLFLSVLTIFTIGIASLKVNFVDRTGFVAALFVGYLTILFGGLKWLVILLSLHFLVGIVSKYRSQRKLNTRVAESKEGVRSWKNILSNGAVATVLVVLYGMTSLNILAAGFLGAVSTSAADTLATELGLLSPSSPRLITRLNVKVKAGTSGGISLLGEISALFGGFILALVAYLSRFGDFGIVKILVLALLVGFLGSNFDSLIGATIQVSFRCKLCRQITEKKIHCKQPTEHYKGFIFLDNNIVNLLSTIFGASIAIFLYNYL